MKRSLSPLEEFLLAEDEDKFRRLKDPQLRQEVEIWLGSTAFAELMQYPVDNKNLATAPKNLVFLPGVMGSTLQSDGWGGVWWLDMLRARDQLNNLALNTSGLDDAVEGVNVVPGTIDLSYIPFRKAVASSNIFGGSEQFPYDWRKSLAASADELRDKILQCHSAYSKPVHVVCHSMGGLMLRTALMKHGAGLWEKIGKIVFIGTPHYGSPSIAGYLKNHLWGWEEIAVVGMFLTRETFRTLRGVLSLLPAPAGIYPGTRNNEAHPCANFDLYDARAWKLDLDETATDHLQSVLDEVRAFHTDLYNWHQSLLQEYKDRMLVIAGVGQKTLFRLEFDSHLWGSWETTHKITARTPGDVNRDGDQRVPLASALLEGVPVRFIKGVHGGLANIPAVIEDVLAWTTERPLRLSKTAAGALAADLSTPESDSTAPALDGSSIPEKFRDLPEYQTPSEEFKQKIAGDIDNNRLPGLNLIHIL